MPLQLGEPEHDLQWALGPEFLRSGSLSYRGGRAGRAALGDDRYGLRAVVVRMAGLQWTHSVGHIGNFFDRTTTASASLGMCSACRA